jgi:hypothetical protein
VEQVTDQPFAPRGRGRPRKLAEVAAPVVAAIQADQPIAAETTVESTKRRRRASVGGHALKLSAPPRKGYTRRWFNDDGNRIADAEELAYEHVHEAGIKTSSPGTRISRLVGTKANGEPLHAFLMETPDELYAEGVAEKEAHNRQIDDAIVAGRDSTGQHQSDGYVGQGSIQRDR